MNAILSFLRLFETKQHRNERLKRERDERTARATLARLQARQHELRTREDFKVGESQWIDGISP